MTEYLVKSHIGGFYCSSEDPIVIEEFCEVCRDSDTIIISWDNEDSKSMYLTLSDYITSEFFTSKESLDEYIKKLRETNDDELFDIMTSRFKSTREFKKIENEDFIKNLFDDKVINWKTASMLIKDNNQSYHKEVCAIKENSVLNKISEPKQLIKIKKK